VLTRDMQGFAGMGATCGVHQMHVLTRLYASTLLGVATQGAHSNMDMGQYEGKEDAGVQLDDDLCLRRL
jgi:hypothetical protein